jgi:multimeric flavodoxin WrbA
MKAILLDGSHAADRTGERVRAALAAKLRTRGFAVEEVVLREKNIGNCAGDFFCWIRSPGVCNVDDDNRAIAAATMASDLLVYLTPVTFGGYSSTLKRMVDHEIQNVSPLFAKVEGETHHKRRYPEYPDFLAVGWMDGPEARAERVFRHLARRNAIDFHARTDVSAVILTSQTDSEILTSAQKWLNDVESGQSSLPMELDWPLTSAAPGLPSEVRRALLLVGSPKNQQSNSNALGGYLFEQLNRRAIGTETMYLHTVVSSPPRMEALFRALDEVDLVTLAFPLYVDSLPAPVIQALEKIAVRPRARESGRPRFSAIANCGFPEAHHTATALAICHTFARQAGFEWAGALGLGGGDMLRGEPLVEKGGQTLRIRQALDLAAEALAQGHSIPEAAQELLGKPIIPAWMYRLAGDLGWLEGARRYGALLSIGQRPYPTSPRREWT